MDLFWWLIIWLVMVAGVIGTLLPLIPGHVLILAGAVLHQLLLGAAKFDWFLILILTGLMLIGLAVDLVSGAAGAKYFGATRWGALGGIFGAVVGLFFGLIGVLIGPLIGVLAGELLGGKGFLPAGKSTWGTFVGGVAGGLIKVILALMMVGIFSFRVFF